MLRFSILFLVILVLETRKSVLQKLKDHDKMNACEKMSQVETKEQSFPRDGMLVR